MWMTSALKRTMVPGTERVTVQRHCWTVCIQSRLTSPSAWLRKWVITNVNKMRPEISRSR